MLRGGDWNNNWNNLRVANRNNNNPDNRNNNIGFRCAAPPSQFPRRPGALHPRMGAVAESEISRSIPGWALNAFNRR